MICCVVDINIMSSVIEGDIDLALNAYWNYDLMAFNKL